MTPNDKPDAEKQKRMWGGRFAEDTDTLVEAFNASIDVDQKMALQDIHGSIAHATMLAEQQILSQDEAAQIIDGLDHIKQDIVEGRFVWKVELEDVHMNIERALTERIGAVGGKLLGAGGGGFILFFVPPEKRAAVRERLKDLIHVEFSFETGGSRVIVYEPNGLESA